MRRAEACVWLRSLLGDRVVSTRDLQQAAREAGIGPALLKIIRAMVGVECFRRELYGPFFVCLPGVEHGVGIDGSVRTDPVTEAQVVADLMLRWRLAQNGGVHVVPSLFEQVAWVSERLLLPFSSISVEEIPCGAALTLLVWAKGNESVFRQMYDCKRIERISARPSSVKSRGSIRVKSDEDVQSSIEGMGGR